MTASLLHLTLFSCDCVWFSKVIITDADKLYDTALATYNLDLVLMVAERSQRDPKEYLPFLAHLKSLSPALAKYEIDTQVYFFSLHLFSFLVLPTADLPLVTAYLLL